MSVSFTLGCAISLFCQCKYLHLTNFLVPLKASNGTEIYCICTHVLAGAGADPGFPVGGGANPPGGTPTYDFSEKLHEIEKILARRGDASLDPPLGRYGVLFLKHEIENNFVLAGDWG